MLLGGNWMRTLVREFGSVARRHHQQPQFQGLLLLIAGTPVLAPPPRPNSVRDFSVTTADFKKQMPPRPKVSENDIEESFLKGSGPGGQKINKTNSAVQLRHIPTGLVVKSQASRSRESNRKTARLLLAEKLEEIEKGRDSRRQILGAIKQKKAASKKKKARRKYRKLDKQKKFGLSVSLAQDGDDADCGEEAEEYSEEEDREEKEAARDDTRQDGTGPSKLASR